MNRESFEQNRASRARAGSKRKRDLDAAGMSKPQAEIQRDAEVTAQRQGAMAWAREHMPELVPDYQSFVADALIRNDRRRIARSVPNVKRTMAATWPRVVERIREQKGKG